MDDQQSIHSRVSALEAHFSEVQARIARLEDEIARLAAQLADQKSLKRFVEMKTGRSGEMSTRIAQRLAKCEAAIEILARVDEGEVIDQT